MTTTGHIRNGMGNVRPYVYGPPGLLPWLEATFAAEVLEMSADGGEVSIRNAASGRATPITRPASASVGASCAR